MICRHCKHQHHERCWGGTWCDCQHRSVALIGHPSAGKTELATAASDNDETEPQQLHFDTWVES